MSPDDRLESATDANDETLEWLSLAGDGTDAGETIRWRGGPRIQTAYPWVGLAAAGVVAALAAVVLELLPVVALAGVPLPALVAFWALASVSRTEYVVTDRRIAIRRGVLGVDVDTVGLERVQNTAVSQHAIARVVGYGTVTIEAASGATFAFRNVEEFDAVHDRLEDQRHGGRTADLPGSVEEWEAILAEVRGWRRALER
ncbi:PH domain-containing protein [Natrialba swarupiae]|uniref:PH domain-containing protein n=1 Tax=Natrialba swarupiae TaxID=2448032 RepID=A0A5D5AWP3_9EURY|nr:PH domain-containing protein [Natrialba swarupiae]TYT63461.1 PH domain-containing protein [Natrialba swarupiae]